MFQFIGGMIRFCWFKQISSVRDISQSSVDEFLRNSGGRRLLRLCLTDGHSEITAVEYSHVPSIPDNVVPGTKVMPFLSSVVETLFIFMIVSLWL